MAKISCCHNCVYSYCDHEQALWSLSVGVLTWPACAHYPESRGRMRWVAARGYDRAAVEVAGEFTRLNLPEEWPAARRKRPL